MGVGEPLRASACMCSLVDGFMVFASLLVMSASGSMYIFGIYSSRHKINPTL